MMKYMNLGELCNKITDGTHHTPTYTEEGIPFLRVTDITESNQSKKFISKEEHLELIKRCNPEKGDILYTKNGTIGVAKKINWDYDFSIFVSLCLLKPNINLVNTDYLVHYLNTKLALNQALSHTKTGTISNLHLIEIKKIKIPLPPLPTQQKIASILDAADTLRQKDKALLVKYDALTQALFLDMFGDPVKNEKGWKEIELGSLLEITSSKRIFKDEYVDNGVPFYRTKEIVELSKGNKISLELFISENRYDEIKLKYEIPQIGDILMSAVGTIGVMWTVDTQKPFYFKDGNLVWLKSSKLKSINSEYLKRTLNYLIEYEKDKLAEGGAYNALTIAKLNQLKVLIAPLKLQNQFVERVAVIGEQKALAQASLEKSEQLFNSLLQKAFKGELV